MKIGALRVCRFCSITGLYFDFEDIPTYARYEYDNTCPGTTHHDVNTAQTNLPDYFYQDNVTPPNTPTNALAISGLSEDVAIFGSLTVKLHFIYFI